MKLTERTNSRLWDALLTDVLAEHCERELDRLDGTAAGAFSPEFDKRIKRLKRSVGLREQAAGMGKAARNTALTLAVVLSLCFCALLTQREVYAAVENVIRETFSDHDSFTFVGDAQPEEEKYLRLGYVPEGYELIQINFGGSVSLQYINGDDMQISLEYALAEDIKISVDNENYTSQEIVKNGQTYYWYYDNVQGCLIWYKDGYAYCLYAQLSLDELVKIAENLK